MPPITKTGPYSQLVPEARRQGRGGHTFNEGGQFLGNVTACEWSVEADQVDVLIPGSWQNAQIPGAEARRGTIRYQDVDDFYRMLVYDFFNKRRAGDFAATAPVFNVQTLLIGGALNSKWGLYGCRLYSYDGGYASADDVMERELAMTFDSDTPLEAFQYTSSGAVAYTLPRPT